MSESPESRPDGCRRVLAGLLQNLRRTRPWYYAIVATGQHVDEEYESGRATERKDPSGKGLCMLDPLCRVLGLTFDRYKLLLLECGLLELHGTSIRVRQQDSGKGGYSFAQFNRDYSLDIDVNKSEVKGVSGKHWFLRFGAFEKDEDKCVKSWQSHRLLSGAGA